MPLPRPRKNEEKNDFINRCMSNEITKRDFPDNTQRVAVCNTQWRQSLKNNMDFTTNNISNNNYTIRTETHQGKKHIVVPVVMMVEGVHYGSGGPILHLEEELSKIVDAWNGIPVTVQHPERNGSPVSANSPDIIDYQTVGRVYNTVFYDGKLKAEAWIEEDKIISVSPEAIAYIRQGRPLDVSTGLFSEDEHISGIWNNEQYEKIARNYRPDHLALLPGQTGACSWNDGCGIRANKNKGDNLMDKKNEINAYRLNMININKEGYQEIIDCLQNKLNAMDTDIKIFYLVEVFDKYCIYKINNNSTNTSMFYKREYIINNDKSAEFIGDPIPVTRKVDYIKTNNSSMEVKTMGEKKNEKKQTGCCPEEITNLIQSNTSGFDENDREWIQTLSKEAIDKLISINKSKEDAVKEIAELKANTSGKKGKTEVEENKELKALKEQLADPEKVMNLLPKEMREQMQYGLKLHQEKRQAFIETIIANTEVFTKNDLANKDINELQKLVSLIKPQANYAPMNTPSINIKTEQEILPPAGVTFKEDK